MDRSFSNSAITFGIFTALSALGGLAKLPSPVGSIALDSAPGYFVAAYFNPVLGGLVGMVGHIASAALAGMPLGYLHLAIMPIMFVWCFTFGLVARSGKSVRPLVIATIIVIIANGIITPFLLIPFGLPRNTAIAILPFLVVASAINVIVAASAAWGLTTFRPGGYSE